MTETSTSVTGWALSILVIVILIFTLRDLIVALVLEPFAEPVVRWFQRTFLGIDAVRAGPEALIGETGLVHADFVLETAENEYSGLVRVNGEVWSARAPTACSLGTQIRVVSREGLVLAVEAL